MKLQNPFPLRVRVLYLYVYSCFSCGRSDKGIELHHIFGRESAAAFNAIPLCKDCHGHVGHTDTEHERYFFLNIEYLLGQRYEPQEDDYDLVRAHSFLLRSGRFAAIFTA
jgi:hypothetical protein